MGLEGKTAIITGGAAGIGKAIASGWPRTARPSPSLTWTLEKAQETVKELEAAGVKAMAVQCDITDYAQTKEAVAAIARTMGEIDILVNNAGVDKQQLFIETDEALWDRMIAVNYKGFLVATHAVIPYMMEQKSGNIVNLGSDAGRIGNAREVVYSGTKAAVMASTKALAQELARFGVRVNAVSPGPIQQTDALGRSVRGRDRREDREARAHAASRYSGGRGGCGGLLRLGRFALPHRPDPEHRRRPHHDRLGSRRAGGASIWISHSIRRHSTSRHEARAWVHEVLDPLCGPLEEEERLPEELVEELRHGKVRFFGLTIPKEYGGEGWTGGQVALRARRSSPTATPWCA